MLPPCPQVAMLSPKQPRACLQQASLPFLEVYVPPHRLHCVSGFTVLTFIHTLCVLTACLLISTALQHVTVVNTAGIHFLLLLLFFWGKVSHLPKLWPWAHSMLILLLYPPKCLDYKHEPTMLGFQVIFDGQQGCFQLYKNSRKILV